jgi:transcriptional regulator with XRE-family HTH domain
MPREKAFAAVLRSWRLRRGWSQLDLAQRAEISQRHLSFLELGRASPSRDMVVQLAAGMARLTEFLVGPLPPDAKINLADALVAPDVLRPFLVNWQDVVRYFIRSVEADAAADGTPESAELLDRLLAHKGVREALKKFPLESGASPVLPMHFRKHDVSLQLFTTIATLGTPQDITAQELRVESFFPMDDESARTLRNWAAKPKSHGA